MARLWAGAESEDKRIEREKEEGIRPAFEPITKEDVTPKVALVKDGLVIDQLIDVHGVTEGGSGVEAVQVDSFADLTVGAPLPWPRAKRDALLAASDWTQQPDLQAQKPDEWKGAWAAYRQALRELPETQPDPLAINWPTEPQR